MASEASDAAIPSAQVVGNAFVEQYYHILHTSPELVYRFYQDSSVLSRPDANGKMSAVATMQGINEKILSFNFKDYKAEIKTADAQKSYMEGVTVLVTGSLTGKDNLKKKFAQSFFLAPQDNGYFVLNDVFRFVDDNEKVDNNAISGGDGVQTVPSIPDPVAEPSDVPDHSAPAPPAVVEAPKEVDVKTIDAAESDKLILSQNERVANTLPSLNENEVCAATEPVSTATEEDAPKKSYASIVKVAKGSSVPTKVYVPTNTSRIAAKKSESHTPVPVSPAPKPNVPAQAPSRNDVPNNDGTQEEAEGYSIYIRNLPYTVTADQLEADFKKFGPIKQDGIQVRFNKQQQYCFGFVEFLSMSSLNDALHASPVMIGGRPAVVEMKRTSSRVGGERGRFSSGRGGFRTDGLRGRGNYGGDRGFGRNDAGGRGEYSGRGRGPGGRGEGYQQPTGRGDGYPQRGRGIRPNGPPKPNAHPS